MAFDCTKPLGDKLELYLINDIDAICDELKLNGIIYESQFENLIFSVCKNNTLEIMELLSHKSGLDIRGHYEKVTSNFVFFDQSRYMLDEAIEKSILFQKLHGNY